MLAAISVLFFIVHNLVVNETVDSRLAIVIVLIGTVLFKGISNVSISLKLLRRKLQLFLKGHRSLILGKDLRRVEIEKPLNGTGGISKGAPKCDLKLRNGNGCHLVPFMK